MTALASILGLLLFFAAAAHSEESPKGPKVTHKVRKKDYTKPLIFFYSLGTYLLLSLDVHVEVADPKW